MKVVQENPGIIESSDYALNTFYGIYSIPKESSYTAMLMLKVWQGLLALFYLNNTSYYQKIHLIDLF